MLEDKVLKCRDCGKDFVFTVKEQEFFIEKGFKNVPSRCPECRLARKAKRPERGLGVGLFGRPPERERKMYEATCAECGTTTQVPFLPKKGVPVYCQQCYRKKKRDFY